LKFNLQLVLEKAHAQESELQKLRPHVSHGNPTTLPYSVNLSNDSTWVNPAISYLSSTTAVPYSTTLHNNSNLQPGYGSLKSIGTIYNDASLAGDAVPMRPRVQPAMQATVPLTTEQIDSLMKTLREAPDKEAQRKAVDELQKVLQKMQEQVK